MVVFVKKYFENNGLCSEKSFFRWTVMEFYACFRVRKNASNLRCSSTLVLNKISAAGSAIAINVFV